MKILHTSDWHIGKPLMTKRRYAEHEAFLDWLLATIEHEHVDALLVAGDIFDTSAPGSTAQRLYYRFLHDVSKTCCQSVIVVAGNHDSPAFINAPADLLRAMNIFVIGLAEAPENEVFVLPEATGAAGAIVCAVPFLRDREMRLSEAGESIDDKGQKLLQGIAAHYSAVAEAAENIRERYKKEYQLDLPLVMMGHLFAAGGFVEDGEGLRELYIGASAGVPGAVFTSQADYIALGHLHSPQMLGGDPMRRYSGSPFALSFSEAQQQKQVCLVEFHGREGKLELLDVPVFQRLTRVHGSLAAIEEKLKSLVVSGENVWVEVIYDGDDFAPNLREIIESLVQGSQIEVLRVKNMQAMQRSIKGAVPDESLDDLSLDEVFARCLEEHHVPETECEELTQLYRAIVAQLEQADRALES